nr:uncharacterized protein LOC123279527 isoform X2 [Equus asinus]
MLDEQRRVRTLTSLQLAAMDSVWLGVTRQPVLELSGLLSLTSGHWHWLQLVPLLGLWNRADLHLAPPCGPGFLVARRPLDSQTSDREAQGPVCERLSKQALPLALEVLWHHFFCHESKGRGGGVHLSVGKRKLKKSVWKRKDCCDYLGKRSATSSVKYRRLESKEHALCFGVHWQNMWFHPGLTESSLYTSTQHASGTLSMVDESSHLLSPRWPTELNVTRQIGSTPSQMAPISALPRMSASGLQNLTNAYSHAHTTTIKIQKSSITQLPGPLCG